jgi:hypothetical protein
MNAGQSTRWRKRASMVVLVLLGIGLAFPFSAALTGRAAGGTGRNGPLGPTIRQKAAVLRAAQLPMDEANLLGYAYLPLVER